MAASISLADLKQRSRELADMVNSRFVSDEELTFFINTEIKALYDKLVLSFEDYYLSSFTTNVSGSTIALPGDFYKLKAVDYNEGGQYVSLRPFQFNDRNRKIAYRNAVWNSTLRYRLSGSVIMLTPDDSCSGTYRVWYVPTCATLTGDQDSFDGINGWEDIVIVGAAIRMKQKEESDTTQLEQLYARAYKRIEAAASNRDMSAPATIVDVFQNDSMNYYREF